MRVIALLATYNEERFIGGCIEHLSKQGVSVYLLDNCSTDRTVEIAERHRDRGLIGLERIERDGAFNLTSLLTAKEALATKLDADWFMHADADEIRLPPRPDITLAEAFAAADAQGYNAVNFMEYTFMPTRESPDHDHADFQKTMRWYYPFRPSFPHRLNAWKKQPGRVDLDSRSGHVVRFPGLRMYPESFPMRHYLYLSIPHAIEKHVRRKFAWNPMHPTRSGWRRHLTEEMLELPSEKELRAYICDEALDASQPRTTHFMEDIVQRKMPAGRGAQEGRERAISA